MLLISLLAVVAPFGYSEMAHARPAIFINECQEPAPGPNSDEAISPWPGGTNANTIDLAVKVVDSETDMEIMFTEVLFVETGHRVWTNFDGWCFFSGGEFADPDVCGYYPIGEEFTLMISAPAFFEDAVMTFKVEDCQCDNAKSMRGIYVPLVYNGPGAGEDSLPEEPNNVSLRNGVPYSRKEWRLEEYEVLPCTAHDETDENGDPVYDPNAVAKTIASTTYVDGYPASQEEVTWSHEEHELEEVMFNKESSKELAVKGLKVGGKSSSGRNTSNGVTSTVKKVVRVGMSIMPEKCGDIVVREEVARVVAQQYIQYYDTYQNTWSGWRRHGPPREVYLVVGTCLDLSDLEDCN